MTVGTNGMTSRGQEPGESTDDAVWQDLVARFNDTPLQADTGPANSGPGNPTDRDRVDAIFAAQPLSGAGPRDYQEPEDPHDGDFVPPDPPAFGSGNPMLVMAWTGAAGAPLLLLLVAMFWRNAPAAALLGIGAVFLACTAFLIWRLPRHREGSDDGAVV